MRETRIVTGTINKNNWFKNMLATVQWKSVSRKKAIWRINHRTKRVEMFIFRKRCYLMILIFRPPAPTISNWLKAKPRQRLGNVLSHGYGTNNY